MPVGTASGTGHAAPAALNGLNLSLSLTGLLALRVSLPLRIAALIPHHAARSLACLWIAPTALAAIPARRAWIKPATFRCEGDERQQACKGNADGAHGYLMI